MAITKHSNVHITIYVYSRNNYLPSDFESVTASLMSVVVRLFWLSLDSVPLMHLIHDLIKETFRFVFIQQLTILLEIFCFSANNSAAREKKRPHSRDISPKQENTSGVYEPWSTKIMRSLCILFFSFSFLRWTAGRDWFRWHLANELKILTSANAIAT